MDETFEVEQIISHTVKRVHKNGKIQVLLEIKWKGYSETSLEPLSHIPKVRPAYYVEYLAAVGLEDRNLC